MGFYPVEGNLLEDGGGAISFPYTRVRMIGQFDHRANSVRINPESTHNPYLSEDVSDEQHADPEVSFLSRSIGFQPSDVEAESARLNRGYMFWASVTLPGPRTLGQTIAAIVPKVGIRKHAPTAGGMIVPFADRPRVQAGMVANLNCPFVWTLLSGRRRRGRT